MEATQHKVKILVMGTLGIGKSTLLNVILNQQEAFLTSDEPDGCTQIPSTLSLTSGNTIYEVVDTPGLNDPNMPISMWVQGYNKAAKQSETPIGLTLLTFKANVRPTMEQRSDLLVVLNAIKGLNANNLAIIFTFCDTLNFTDLNKNGEQKYKGWFQTMQKICKGDNASAVLKMDHQRIFFFSKENGKMGDATTHQQIIRFIDQFADKQSVAKMNTELEVSTIAKSAIESGDVALMQMFKEQMTQMKEMYQLQLNQNNEQKDLLVNRLNQADIRYDDLMASMSQQKDDLAKTYRELNLAQKVHEEQKQAKIQAQLSELQQENNTQNQAQISILEAQSEVQISKLQAQVEEDSSQKDDGICCVF